MKQAFGVLVVLALLFSGCATISKSTPPEPPKAVAGEVMEPDVIVLRFLTEEGEESRSLRITPDGKTNWGYSGIKKTPSAVSVWVDRNGTLIPYGGGGGSEKPSATVDPNAFVIGPGDVIDVNVWKNAELSRVVPVRPDGNITLPLMGDVRAAGLTVPDLKAILTKRVRDFMKTPPEVTVIIAEVHSYQVFIEGQVQSPGTYPISGTTTLVQLIALSGGFGQFANKGRITLLRQTADGTRRIVASYDRIIDGRSLDVILRPGDMIIVP
ncbi:MAG: polysaccharide biosynthesis/export family protein [Candidatus Lernaella stagnicola]|nr:polysaccharide biosynthesis/export family protein [Candidatus Lernaella stagnicola]